MNTWLQLDVLAKSALSSLTLYLFVLAVSTLHRHAIPQYHGTGHQMSRSFILIYLLLFLFWVLLIQEIMLLMRSLVLPLPFVWLSLSLSLVSFFLFYATVSMMWPIAHCARASNLRKERRRATKASYRF